MSKLLVNEGEVMNIKRLLSSFVLIVLSVAAAHASVFGDVRGFGTRSAPASNRRREDYAAFSFVLILANQSDRWRWEFLFPCQCRSESTRLRLSLAVSKFTLAVTVLSDHNRVKRAAEDCAGLPTS